MSVLHQDNTADLTGNTMDNSLGTSHFFIITAEQVLYIS